jgi:hypothetical protein
MVDNFELLKPFMTFEDDSKFYFLQVIKRRKDNPELKGNNKVISNYQIYSLEDYHKYYLYAVRECQLNNARAYLRLNVRDDKKVGLECLRRMANLIADGNHKAVKNTYDTVCGKHHSDKNKKWIVDFDDEWMPEKDDRVQDIIKAGGKIYAEIPTKSGCHIISSPFNLSKFKWMIDIHKDNPTILYIP